MAIGKEANPGENGPIKKADFRAERESKPWSIREQDLASELPPEDVDFLKHITSRARLSAFIDNLEEEGSGTMVTLVCPSDEIEEEETDSREVFRSVVLPSTMNIGYALPRNKEGTSHLFLFKNGEFMVTEPYPPPRKIRNNAINIRRYKEAFSMGMLEFTSAEEDRDESLDNQIKQAMFSLGEDKVHVVKSGYLSGNRVLVRDTLLLARELKRGEENARYEGIEELLDEAEKLGMHPKQVFPSLEQGTVDLKKKEPPDDESPQDFTPAD